MTDQLTMRLRLQQVAAYRELRRSVQRSGRENVVFSLVMMGLAYFLHSQGLAGAFLLLYCVLIAGELLVGLFKWAAPSAEGFLLDGFVMAAFAAFIGWREYLAFQKGGGLNPIYVFFALLILSGALNKFRAYGQLRRLFAERPDPEHIAWFDDLVREIQTADPVADRLVLDLPTKPHWKAKLLGTTAFFVTATGNTVWIAGADDFSLRREKADRGTGYRKALLSIYGQGFPEFELDDASWDNYVKWAAALPQEPGTPAR
jgi:hypothetical protein